MNNYWVVEPVSCWHVQHQTGISRWHHQKNSCLPCQRNIPPLQFLECLIQSPGMPKRTFLLTSQGNVPSILEFLHYPITKTFLFTSQKNLLVDIIDYLMQIPRSPKTSDRPDCSGRTYLIIMDWNVKKTNNTLLWFLQGFVFHLDFWQHHFLHHLKIT